MPGSVACSSWARRSARAGWPPTHPLQTSTIIRAPRFALPGRKGDSPMSGRMLGRTAWLVLAGAPLVLTAAGVEAQPVRKFEINKITCAEFTALTSGEERDRALIYMNGYLDGTKKATTWDAEVIGKRIDQVVSFCKANPRSGLLDAFKRAWTR
jgi:hypothetical protein